MNNRYFLMRHGESLANLSNTIISSPQSGLSGFGLSPRGFEQAEQNALASGLPSSTVVLASDFLRTRQTAATVSQALDTAPPKLHSELRERGFGQLEQSTGDDYRKVWAEDEKDPYHTLFGVESAEALATRLMGLLESLENEFHDKDILLVSHGDPLRFLQLAAAGRPLTEHLQVRLFAPAEIRRLDALLSA